MAEPEFIEPDLTWLDPTRLTTLSTPSVRIADVMVVASSPQYSVFEVKTWFCVMSSKFVASGLAYT